MTRYPWEPVWERPAAAPVLTVSELVFRAGNALESEFGTVAVEGEISSLSRPRSGHVYWTLKDAASAVECVMYRSDSQRLRFELEDGAHVMVVARPSIYRARGRFQLVVTEVVSQGRGALYLKLEALREKLAAEGLFDAGRKRRIPYWPATIGVVTSAEGAAVRDICIVIRRRAPATRILIKPVPVQGKEAAPAIARAIHWFDEHRVADVLIVGRGGGSLEDLWAFNEEIVVRAIVQSAVPVVSAVGHETDTTLADLAADLRAPTPSAAAESVVPETRAIGRLVVQCFRRLSRAMERQRLARIEAALAPIKRYGFRRVRDRAAESRQRWGEAADALRPALMGRLDGSEARLAGAREALADPLVHRHDVLARRAARGRQLPREVARRHERVRTRHGHLVRRLHAVSPFAILERGYALVAGPDGRLVTEAAALSARDALTIQLARGEVRATVEATNPDKRPHVEDGG